MLWNWSSVLRQPFAFLWSTKDNLENHNFHDYLMHFMESTLKPSRQWNHLFHSKLSRRVRVKRGRLSWWGINRHTRKEKEKKTVDNASHRPNNHSTLFKRKVAPSSFKSTFHNRACWKKKKKKCFWESRKKKRKAHHRWNSDPGIDVCKREKEKLYMQAWQGKRHKRRRTKLRRECELCLKAIADSNERRRALVHPYVFKIAKFSSITQTMPKFFREFVMGAS